MSENEIPFLNRVVREKATGRKLRIQIFAPCPMEDDWMSSVVLTFDDGTALARKNCFGIDSIQSIQSTFSFVRQQLQDNYVWGEEDAVLGFPASLPSVFGKEFYRKMEELVAAEELKFVSQNKRTRNAD